MENGRILAACAGTIHAFGIFFTVYPLSVASTYIRTELKLLLTIIIYTSDITCREISASKVNGLFIVHVMLGLLADDFGIDGKY